MPADRAVGAVRFRLARLWDWATWRCWNAAFRLLNIWSLRRRQAGPPATPRQALLIHTLRVGDTIVITPLVAALKRRFPDCAVDLVTSAAGREVVAENPHLRRVLVFDGSAAGATTLVAELRGRGYDLAIDLNNGFAGARRELLALRSGARRRISFRRRGYRAARPTDEVDYRYIHAVDVFLLPLAALGIDPGSVDRRYTLYLSAVERQWARETLAAHGLAKPLILLNPSTLEPTKRWPAERFAWVADELVRKQGASVLITAAPEEWALADAVATLMRERCVSLAGRTTLRQYFALIAASDLVLSVDTAAVHAAQAFGVPVVALFNPVTHSSWRPLEPSAGIALVGDAGCPRCWRESPGGLAAWRMRCLHDPPACLAAIRRETVLDACRRLLASARGTQPR